jgi:hypothetical protein
VLLKVSDILDSSINVVAHSALLGQYTSLDSLRQLAINENEEGVQELTDWAPVSYFWPAQPADDRLHIFVKLPAAGEKRLSFLFMTSSDNDAFFYPHLLYTFYGFHTFASVC